MFNENRDKKKQAWVNSQNEKHKTEKNGKNIWVFDSGKECIIPDISEQKNIIFKKHVELSHRSVEPVYYALKDVYYWIGMKKTIGMVLKECRVCKEMNRKRKIGNEFVVTSRPLEKVSLDLIKMHNEEGYVLVSIDYFTRYVLTEYLEKKSSEGIVNTISKWCSQGRIPEEIITDNAKEFISQVFKENMAKFGIKHKKVAIEDHRGNGRVERVIRTLRESLLKENDSQKLGEKIGIVTNKYNDTYHSGIKCTPREAFLDKSGIASIENSKSGKYIKQFKKTKTEEFNINDIVLISKRENIRNKDFKGRFIDQGKIIANCENNSYLIMLDNGKITKKRYFEIKLMKDETNRFGGGMLNND